MQAVLWGQRAREGMIVRRKSDGNKRNCAILDLFCEAQAVHWVHRARLVSFVAHMGCIAARNRHKYSRTIVKMWYKLEEFGVMGGGVRSSINPS